MTAVAETSLYTDPLTGKRISTNSMLKSFLRCPKQADYKYYQRLKPLQLSRPLGMGKWMHSLLEAHYKCEAGIESPEWGEVNHRLTKDFAKLFDEEKDALGDLPRACPALMRSYLWHYKNHAWKVLGVEGLLETDMPDGSIFRGRYDMLVEDDYGIWLVDHKNHKRFPNFQIRLIDTQAPRYIWAARQMGIPVQGFIWNYLKTKPMTVPTPIQSGARLSMTTMKNCDFPTAVKAIKKAELDLEDYRPWLVTLKHQRYQHGEAQNSPFFQRVTLEMPQEQLDRVAVSTFHTVMRMHDYDFSVTDAVERVPDRSCEFMCSYNKICMIELYGGNSELSRRKEYSVGDPQDYYYDELDYNEPENS